MPTAYYMRFHRGHSGAKDRVGGQPTHLPVRKPWQEEDDPYFGFMLELWVDGTRLDVPGTISLQLYQPIEEGDDPTPQVVQVREDDPLNTSGEVLAHPFLQEWDIHFEAVEEPEVLPEASPTPSFGRFFMSKLGGLDPWEKDVEGRVFLGQVHESPVDFNFGGMLCSLYLESDGFVTVELS